MNRAIRTVLAVVVGVAVSGVPLPTKAEVGKPAPAETTELHDARLKWFREARFGMFIHWGVYAVPAGVYKEKDIPGIGEWIMKNGSIPVADYKAFAKDFTAAKYDPESWVALAKKAGMRYVVITSKHHDGCTLFDSAVSDWTVVKATGAKRDLIAPLEKAVRAQGLRLGLYYSQAQDWMNPGGGCYGKKWDPAQEGDYDQYLTKVAVPQVEELLSKFHPDLVWWDTPANMTSARAAYFAPVLAKYPDLVMNNRLGGGVQGDCETPEQHIPPRGFPGRDFEVCMTMNDTWGYKSKDDKWKPTKQILEHLSDISSKGGNFLLNVGPTAEGLIPQASIERLEAVGKWMDVNGEAIHGTQASPFAKRLPWGRVTRKADLSGGGETLYLHVWDWPGHGKLLVPGAAQEGAKASLMSTKASLEVAVQNGDLVVSVPAQPTDPIISVVMLHLPKAIVDKSPALKVPDAQGMVHLSVLDADAIGNYGGNMPVSGSGTGAYLGPWTDAGWKLEYRFSSPKAQKWMVQGEIAAVAPVTLGLNVGKTKTPAAVAATGGAQVWKPVDLGIVQLGAGEVVFILSAEKKNWTAIGLRTINLKPVH
jgi:alpha-L-fucosidase